MRLGEYPPVHGRQAVRPGEEQLGGGRRREAGEREFGQPRCGERAFAVPGGEEQHDALRLQSAGGEQQCLGGRAVQPLRIVDQAQQRLLGGQFGEQPEDGQAGQQPVAGAVLGESERALQGAALRPRQSGDPFEAGREQQAEPREGQFGLALHPGRPDRPERLPCLPGRVLQQRALADPRLPAQDEHPAPAVPRPSQQPVDHTLLVRPPVQHDSHPIRRPPYPPGPTAVPMAD